MASYTTTETEGQVSVCVTILNTFGGERTEPFDIVLLPEESKLLAHVMCFIWNDFPSLEKTSIVPIKFLVVYN